LNEQVIPLPQARLHKKADELAAKLQDMYEKHTKLGTDWQALHRSPEQYLGGRELLIALQKRLLKRLR
jgi:hypothetical protein